MPVSATSQTKRKGLATYTRNPVLIGVVTSLCIAVVVMIGYNANKGLPFVPTYNLKVEVPDADGLVKNNEVRIAGFRVGIIDDITKVQHNNGSYTAMLSLKLNTTAKPIYKNATYIVRSTSVLGLKYLDLSPGSAAKADAVPAGSTIGLSRGSEPVSVQDWRNVFDAPTRKAIRINLEGWGGALTGRGLDLNESIANLSPLLKNLQPVATAVALPSTDLTGFVANLATAAQIVAPAAQQFASLFVNLNTTFAALAPVAPQLAEAIGLTPETFKVVTGVLPDIRPFLKDTTELAAELRPSFASLRNAVPDLADGVVAGVQQLPRVPDFNKRLISTVDTFDGFVKNPSVSPAVQKLTEATDALDPFLAYVAPAQTSCQYLSMLLSNAESFLSQGSDVLSSWLQFTVTIPPAGTNNLGLPSSVPANGPGTAYLHANPYPYTASPGQPKLCVAGREAYSPQTQVVIGNPSKLTTSGAGQ